MMDRSFCISGKSKYNERMNALDTLVKNLEKDHPFTELDYRITEEEIKKLTSQFQVLKQTKL